MVDYADLVYPTLLRGQMTVQRDVVVGLPSTEWKSVWFQSSIFCCPVVA